MSCLALASLTVAEVIIEYAVLNINLLQKGATCSQRTFPYCKHWVV